MHIFLDESGQFSPNGREKHFVVASFSVDNPHRTAKGFRSWCRNHFPRKMRDQSEIKWSATGISDALRLKTLRYIAKLGINIRYIYLNHKDIPIRYRSRNGLQSGTLYRDLVCSVLRGYADTADKTMFVFCDHRSLLSISRQEFEVSVQNYLLSICNDKVVHVKMIDSVTSCNIQIADWITGALARYVEKGKFGNDGYEILKNHLTIYNVGFDEN